MSSVYVVVATRDSEIEACESFAGVQSALGRGFQLASNKAGRGRTDLFVHSPNEEVLSDGSIRWVFMDTNKQSVIVFYRKIEEAILSSKDPASVIVPPLPSAPAVQTAQPNPYDFMDRSLPAGWKLDGQPATMGDMLDGPFAVKDPLWDLTDVQKWALVTSRIRKSPNYRNILGSYYPSTFTGATTTDHLQSLTELKNKTQLGEQIRDAEIEALHALREDLIAGINHS